MAGGLLKVRKHQRPGSQPNSYQVVTRKRVLASVLASVRAVPVTFLQECTTKLYRMPVETLRWPLSTASFQHQGAEIRDAKSKVRLSHVSSARVGRARATNPSWPDVLNINNGQDILFPPRHHLDNMVIPTLSLVWQWLTCLPQVIRFARAPRPPSRRQTHHVVDCAP